MFLSLSVEGRLDGKYIRKSLKVRDWDSAQRLVRDWEAGAKERKVSIKEACRRFEADAEARKLGPAQMGKYRLLTKELTPFFPDRVVSGISVDDIWSYRESWGLASVTAGKRLERLRTFFKFCQQSGWTEGNPARLLKPPKANPALTLPFTKEEMEKILWVCEVYPDRPRGRRKQMRAFVLLLH